MNIFQMQENEVMVEKLNSKEDLDIGDIVLYENEFGIKLLHRIMFISEDINGLYLLSENKKIRLNQIIGKIQKKYFKQLKGG